ncbi:acyl-CoA thioesterase [Enterococcus massiliensis]|uniref:acyl-CoA thioesterase n=1 Tax=Enterococcus massiliensis TaxID=1640685 RepID=UPI00065E8412|nr:acyl-CoA thioesterase [Enterococcus massiliensis]
MNLYPGYVRTPHYYETDQMGIIHHSNYIRWFEEARVALLDYLHLPYQQLEAAGIIVPVLAVSCQYKQMIRYEDSIRIAIFVENYTGTRLDFRYEIYNTKEQLLTTGASEHCFLNRETGRLIQLKKTQPEMHQIFATYAKLH